MMDHQPRASAPGPDQTAAPPLRIAYFAHVQDADRSAVFHKTAAQVDQWRAAGHEVRLFLLTVEAPDVWRARFGDVEIRAYCDISSRLRGMTELVNAVRRYRPELVYLRWFIVYPQM